MGCQQYRSPYPNHSSFGHTKYTPSTRTTPTPHPHACWPAGAHFIPRLDSPGGAELLCTLNMLLGAVAVLGTGAATIGTDLTQPAASWLYRPASCPLPWLPVLLADAPPTNRRRLVDHVFTTKGALQTAVRAYNDNVASAEATYGPIVDWDVSGITDMSDLFLNLVGFNADINSWDTSSVSNMEGMFRVVRASSLV